ncbi:exonuclease III [Actinobacillus equuli]|nr:exonuclease III [Actinobacillus equuli]
MIMADIETEFGVLTVLNGYFPQGEIVRMKLNSRQKKILR